MQTFTYNGQGIEEYTGPRLRFNPFKRVSCKYGAPMGRHGYGVYDGESPLFIRHCGGDGYYDKGGAYWGDSKVYAVFDKSGHFCQYVENPLEYIQSLAQAV